MKRALLAVVLLGAVAAQALTTTEVLVLTTPTALPVLRYRRIFEVQNLGPNDIFCAGSSAGAVANKARRIAANGGAWSFSGGDAVWCVAATANQVTGAATITSEAQ
jgi:hypothetical protein